MDKKNNYKYHIQLNMVQGHGSEENLPAPLDFNFESHDDIFRILTYLKESQHFANEQQAMEFAVGLKLFSGVMLKNKDSELFRDFQPAFGAFMRKLKGK